MSIWIHVFDLLAFFAVFSTFSLVAWCAWDVWRTRPPRRGATRHNRRDVVVLQWRRRQALRRLGSNWVLHESQPDVRWGHRYHG